MIREEDSLWRATRAEGIGYGRVYGNPPFKVTNEEYSINRIESKRERGYELVNGGQVIGGAVRERRLEYRSMASEMAGVEAK